jgi:hypothetical protein
MSILLSSTPIEGKSGDAWSQILPAERIPTRRRAGDIAFFSKEDGGSSFHSGGHV